MSGAQGQFGLTEDEFWSDPWKQAEALYERHIIDEALGLFIDAPRVVGPSARATIPILLVFAAREREAWRVDVRAQATLVAVRLADREVFVSAALEPLDNAAPELAGGRDSDAVTTEHHEIDAHARLGLLDQPGDYRIVVIIGERRSNPVELRVEGRSFANPDPEVERFLEARRRPRLPALPDRPTRQLLSARERAPSVPAEPGIELAIERVVVLEPGVRVMLELDYRLELRPPWDRIPADALGYGEPRPRAILAIELVMVGRDDPARVVVPLRIPHPVELGDVAIEVVGSFAVDLIGRELIGRHATTWVIYALCGEFMAGPSLVALVTPEMLPRPGE